MTFGRLDLERLLIEVGYTGPDSRIIVETFLKVIADHLVKGDAIEIRGFGTLHSRMRRPHIGRNPRTGAAVTIPSHRKYHFRASNELRRLINERGN